MPGHQCREEECGNRGVALGQLKARADAAAFLDDNQNVLLEHQLANVFEPNGHFVEFSSKFCRKLVDKLCYGKCFCDITRQVAGSREVPDEQRKDLVGVDERAVAVDGADTVAVSVSAEARGVLSGAHSL